MCYAPILLLTAFYFAQVSQPAAAPANSTPAAAAAAPAAPATEPKTEHDTFVERAADRLEKISFVEAEMKQTIRAGDHFIHAKGIYKKGPNNKARLQLDVQLGDSVGQRLFVSDGRVGYRYEKLLDSENLRSFDVCRIMTLLERKETTPAIRRQIQLMLPFLQPSDILRGLLDTVTFTSQKSEMLNDRKVVVVVGQWKQAVIGTLTRNPGVTTVEQLEGETPQYIRITIDEETGWPLRISLFRRERTTEMKPTLDIEFQKLALNKPIADAEFAYLPPKELEVEDQTQVFLNQIDLLKDKSGADVPATNPGTGVSEPIVRPTKN